MIVEAVYDKSKLNVISKNLIKKFYQYYKSSDYYFRFYDSALEGSLTRHNYLFNVSLSGGSNNSLIYEDIPDTDTGEIVPYKLVGLVCYFADCYYKDKRIFKLIDNLRSYYSLVADPELLIASTIKFKAILLQELSSVDDRRKGIELYFTIQDSSGGFRPFSSGLMLDSMYRRYKMMIPVFDIEKDSGYFSQVKIGSTGKFYRKKPLATIGDNSFYSRPHYKDSSDWITKYGHNYLAIDPKSVIRNIPSYLQKEIESVILVRLRSRPRYGVFYE